MKVIHIVAKDITSEWPVIAPSAVAIGNFDGVHLGHQHILSKLKIDAKANQLASVVVSFEPYPREYFASANRAQDDINTDDNAQSSSNKSFRLMTQQEKNYVLSQYDIDYFIVIKFDALLASMSADDFVETLLVQQLNTQSLYVGNDFRFGFKRLGDVNLLQQLANHHDYRLNVIPDFRVNNQRVSSTLIRQCLKNNDLASANALLGRAHIFIGQVVHGDKRGREIGFATANIEIEVHKLLLTGVYAIKVSVLEEGWLDNLTNGGDSFIKEPIEWINGVCNLGYRPTYHSDVALLEAHLFDWNEMIYGQTLVVQLVQKIRSEKRFENFEALQKQIHNDALTARKLLG